MNTKKKREIFVVLTKLKKKSKDFYEHIRESVGIYASTLLKHPMQTNTKTLYIHCLQILYLVFTHIPLDKPIQMLS